MKSALLITFLLHLQHACFVSGNCIKGDDYTSTIMDEEALLTEEDLDTTRTYIMCPNSRVQVQEYDYGKKDFTGNGTEALSIWNRNVRLQCGNGKIENNCRFVGGTYQIEIISADQLFKDREIVALTGIVIEGFQFVKAQEGNIFIYGAEVGKDDKIGADVKIINCKFADNTGVSIEALYNDRTKLLIKGSKFVNNRVQDFGDSGLINVADMSGIYLDLRRCSFVNNNLLPFDTEDESNYIVRLSGPKYKNTIYLSDNEFRGNTGINAFVFGSFQNSDDYVIVDEELNLHEDNEFTGSMKCKGIKGSTDLNTEEPACLEKFEKYIRPTVSPAPTFSPTLSLQPTTSYYDEENECIKERFTKVVYNAELMLSPEEIKDERVYSMCPGTVLKISSYDWKNEEAVDEEGTEPPLQIWNPNVKIMCGTKEIKSNDCVMKGGDHQIEIVDAKYISEGLETNALKGIIIKGITFKGAEYENILIYGTEPSGNDKGADISIINCIFKDNEGVTLIDIMENRNTYLTIDQTTFIDNNIYHYEPSPNVGLINAAKMGAFVTVTNSKFENNDVGKKGFDGYSWLIYLGGLPFPVLDSGLQISNTIFLNNTGMYNAIAAGGFLYDGDFSAKGNTALSNTFKSDELKCQGILRIRKNGGNEENDFYWECADQFDKIESTVAPTLSPTSFEPPQSECLGSDFPKKIMQAEKKLNVTNLSRKRTYTVCKDTVTNVMDWDYDKEEFNKDTGDEKALSIFYSNIAIRCEKKNTCSMIGGIYQIEILSATVFDEDFEYLPVTNVEIIGFNFGTGSSQMEANILINGVDIQQTFENLPDYGASLTLRNCVFEDVNAVSMIWIFENYNTKLTIDGCSFINNKLIDSEEAPNSGLILSGLTGDIVITDTQFIGNDVSVVGDVSGVRSIVYVVETEPTLSGNQHETDINITDSSFIENVGITFAPVIVGLWKDGIIEHKNNIYEGNTINDALDPECNGFAHFTQDYYYYDYYNNFTWNSEFALDFTDCLGNFTVNVDDDDCDSEIEPETVMKPGSTKQVYCSQDNNKDQKKKCKMEWFANKCKRSCCVKACPTEEPKKVQKPDSSEKVTCAQKKKKVQKKKCKKSWFKDACVVSCCKANSDDSEKEKNKPECEIFTDSSKKVTKPGTKKKSDCKQKKKKDQKKKCEKDYFRDVCSNTCCNIGLPPVIPNPECNAQEPDKVMKDDGSKDMVECKQGSEKDQKKKCKKDYFRNVCVYSCCQAGFPPVDSKCANLEQPKEVLKEGSTKTLKCEQDNEDDQVKNCGKKYFLDVCTRSCCEVGFSGDGSDPKCALSEPEKVVKPDSKKKFYCSQDDAEEQASKCGKGWFAAVCIKSCCDNVA